jgi:Dolichyl-phosphate-mannose-protein mannosyltransferase
MAAPEIVVQPSAVPADRAGGEARPARADHSRSILAVVALTVLGAALRIVVAHQSVFADELSTYWISVDHSLGGVLSLLYSTGPIHHAEITPPLSFLASWLTTRPGSSPELLRLPSLLAGTATIPLIYLLGRRTVGARAALLAAAVTALSPFMIYYSTEARAYGLMMFFVVGAVLSMLLAIDTGRNRYWWLYAICSATAFYSHYTCIFVLGVALAWLLWSEPARRRAALLATAGAALLVVPWIPGLIADLRSPTVTILSDLSPFTANSVTQDLGHWALGYPFIQVPSLALTSPELSQLPGVPALVLLGLALILSVAGIAERIRHGAWRGERPRALARSRIALLVVLTIATPLGEIVVSATGNHIFDVRDLAASWPFLALFGAAFAVAAGRRLGTAAAALAVVAFCLAASKVLEPGFQRPDYRGLANYVTARARAGDVVIDETGVPTPGPLTGFDVVYRGHLTVVRAGVPAERDHPFMFTDPVVPVQTAVSQAVRDARGERVFLLAPALPALEFPDGYRLVALRRYPGLIPMVIGVYGRSPTP